MNFSCESETARGEKFLFILASLGLLTEAYRKIHYDDDYDERARMTEGAEKFLVLVVVVCVCVPFAEISSDKLSLILLCSFLLLIFSGIHSLPLPLPLLLKKEETFIKP
jgi:hypothetical protein